MLRCNYFRFPPGDRAPGGKTIGLLSFFNWVLGTLLSVVPLIIRRTDGVLFSRSCSFCPLSLCRHGRLLCQFAWHSGSWRYIPHLRFASLLIRHRRHATRFIRAWLNMDAEYLESICHPKLFLDVHTQPGNRSQCCKVISKKSRDST